MSTLDPGMEPPGDWQTAYPPTDTGPNPTGGKAAVYVWITAGVQLALSSCCGLIGVMLLVLSSSEIAENIPHDMPNREQTIQMLPVMGPAVAIGSVVLGFLPAIILGILAFWVRRGARAATIIALVILAIQSAGLALMVLNYILAMVMYQALSILLMVVIIGAILALFVKTCIELINVLRRPDYPNPPDYCW